MPDELTWLRDRLEAMTPGPWVDGAGEIFAAVDLVDGMVADDKCEVASCYGANRHAEEAGIVALRNVSPAMLAVIEAAERHHRVRGGWCSCGRDEHQCRERSALDAFRAAVREEQDRG